MKALLSVHTDNEVDLRSKLKRQVFVAHELVHLQRLDDTHLRNTLFTKIEMTVSIGALEPKALQISMDPWSS